MNTIDNILLTLINTKFNKVLELSSISDSRILKSLAIRIASDSYITENQGNLICQVLIRNYDYFQLECMKELLTPTWAKSFRQIVRTKRLSIFQHEKLHCEFTFAASIKDSLHRLYTEGPVVSGLNFYNTAATTVYTANLSESNIVAFIDAIKQYHFDIDPTLIEYYNLITSWNKEAVINQFLITTIKHENFQKKLLTELGSDTLFDITLINDRSIRYQYFVDRLQNPSTLLEIIANRNHPKLWIDRGVYSIYEVLQSLMSLRRFPVLLVFDDYSDAIHIEELQLVADALDALNITENVGIYFRKPNDILGKDFNNIITQRGYNCMLDTNTLVAGVSSGKIPKFMITTEWQPMSVIVMGSSLKHNKTAIYSNCCDLIISYTNQEPII